MPRANGTEWPTLSQCLGIPRETIQADDCAQHFPSTPFRKDGVTAQKLGSGTTSFHVHTSEMKPAEETKNSEKTATAAHAETCFHAPYHQENISVRNIQKIGGLSGKVVRGKPNGPVSAVMLEYLELYVESTKCRY